MGDKAVSVALTYKNSPLGKSVNFLLAEIKRINKEFGFPRKNKAVMTEEEKQAELFIDALHDLLEFVNKTGPQFDNKEIPNFTSLAWSAKDIIHLRKLPNQLPSRTWLMLSELPVEFPKLVNLYVGKKKTVTKSDGKKILAGIKNKIDGFDKDPEKYLENYVIDHLTNFFDFDESVEIRKDEFIKYFDDFIEYRLIPMSQLDKGSAARVISHPAVYQLALSACQLFHQQPETMDALAPFFDKDKLSAKIKNSILGGFTQASSLDDLAKSVESAYQDYADILEGVRDTLSDAVSDYFRIHGDKPYVADEIKKNEKLVRQLSEVASLRPVVIDELSDNHANSEKRLVALNDHASYLQNKLRELELLESNLQRIESEPMPTVAVKYQRHWQTEVIVSYSEKMSDVLLHAKTQVENDKQRVTKALQHDLHVIGEMENKNSSAQSAKTKKWQATIKLLRNAIDEREASIEKLTQQLSIETQHKNRGDKIDQLNHEVHDKRLERIQLSITLLKALNDIVVNEINEVDSKLIELQHSDNKDDILLYLGRIDELIQTNPNKKINEMRETIESVLLSMSGLEKQLQVLLASSLSLDLSKHEQMKQELDYLRHSTFMTTLNILDEVEGRLGDSEQLIKRAQDARGVLEKVVEQTKKNKENFNQAVKQLALTVDDQLLLDTIDVMRQHGVKLAQMKNSQDQRYGYSAIDLADKLTRLVEFRGKPGFEDKFTKLLHSKDHIMRQHRARWKVILANILLVLPLAGRHLYALVKGKQPSLFFSQTKRQRHVGQIEKVLHARKK